MKRTVITKATNNGEQSTQVLKANTGEDNRALITNIGSSSIKHINEPDHSNQRTENPNDSSTVTSIEDPKALQIVL